MSASFLSAGLYKTDVAPAVEQGRARDEQFFADHPDRNYRIRKPITAPVNEQPDEFEQEFRSLGDHDASRRRIIVKRVERAKARQFGVRFMPIPFLLFADESLRDDDATLRPLFDAIMKEAATAYETGA